MKKKGGVGSLETCKVATKGCRWVEQRGGGGGRSLMSMVRMGGVKTALSLHGTHMLM